MGTWGMKPFENEPASDWIGHVERVGFVGVLTPMVMVNEYLDKNRPIPAELEQEFLASCYAVCIALGHEEADLSSIHDGLFVKLSSNIARIPNLKKRFTHTITKLSKYESELESLWGSNEESTMFKHIKNRIISRILNC